MKLVSLPLGTEVAGKTKKMRRCLRKCIHYMRVKEVVYVLETAHVARNTDERFQNSIGDVGSCTVCSASCSRLR